jgi:hypothetical protein
MNHAPRAGAETHAPRVGFGLVMRPMHPGIGWASHETHAPRAGAEIHAPRVGLGWS